MKLQPCRGRRPYTTARPGAMPSLLRGMCAVGFSPGTPLANAQVAPWGEIRQQPSRTEPKPRKNAVSVGVKNISTPSLHILYQ